MRRSLLATALFALLVLMGSMPAAAAPDQTISLAPGDEATVDSSFPTGVNFCYYGIPFVGGGDCPVLTPATCTHDVTSNCDVVLLEITKPVPDDDLDGKVTGKVTIALRTGEYSDYDLNLFASDANGSYGPALSDSTASPPPTGTNSNEDIVQSLTFTRTAPTQYVLLEVVHWLAVDDHTTTVKFL